MDYRFSLWRTCLGAGMILSSILLLLAPAAAQIPRPPAPDGQTETRDLTEPPIRTLRAEVDFYSPRWNSTLQKATGAAIAINFSGPAAPLDQVGKLAKAGAIRMSPERPHRCRASPGVPRRRRRTWMVA